MTTPTLTIDSILAQLEHRPALARALSQYAYTIEHVSRGEHHAAEHQARMGVYAAVEMGTDVDAWAFPIAL